VEINKEKRAVKREAPRGIHAILGSISIGIKQGVREAPRGLREGQAPLAGKRGNITPRNAARNSWKPRYWGKGVCAGAASQKRGGRSWAIRDNHRNATGKYLQRQPDEGNARRGGKVAARSQTESKSTACRFTQGKRIGKRARSTKKRGGKKPDFIDAVF